MTTQPQSPSEQIEALNPKWQYFMVEDGRYLVNPETVQALITQAADKREQEVLDDLTEYYQGLLADRPATVKFPAWIGKNELQAWIDGRQGKAAEGEGKNA